MKPQIPPSGTLVPILPSFFLLGSDTTCLIAQGELKIMGKKTNYKGMDRDNPFMTRLFPFCYYLITCAINFYRLLYNF